MRDGASRIRRGSEDSVTTANSGRFWASRDIVPPCVWQRTSAATERSSIGSRPCLCTSSRRTRRSLGCFRISPPGATPTAYRGNPPCASADPAPALQRPQYSTNHPTSAHTEMEKSRDTVRTMPRDNGAFGKLSDPYQYGLVPALVPGLAVFSSKLTLAGARKQPSRSGNRNRSHAQTVLLLPRF